jgi:glycosyltransferase involved in cell wall biosynthesis
MQIELLVGRYDRMMGLAWYAASLQKYLSRLRVDCHVTQPDFPLPIRFGHALLKPRGYDLKAFFTLYPVSASLKKDTLKHFTTQQMASLFSFKKDIHPVIITVHDIIPYLMRDNPTQSDYLRRIDRWVDGLAMHNIRRADCVIAVSDYSRRMLINQLGVDGGKIRVILHGLDLEIFKPGEVGDKFREQYHLPPGYQYILYVGSEIPRKNLPRLLEAFALLKQQNTRARLIKIGSPVRTQWYQELLAYIQRLGIQDEVLLFEHVNREDLISFYNLADVFVFPSLAEGFGLPPLEAMACGTPVICSNAASLPEVVGDAAISVDPTDIQGWADAMEEVLNNQNLQVNLRSKSRARASLFSWERMTRETLDVYQEFVS